jgi:hypothetical protein
MGISLSKIKRPTNNKTKAMSLHPLTQNNCIPSK